ncbi:MAG: CinA family protein [Fibrobacter sp.]|nr:CinA family protein [Fibrobacter sp.]
MNEIRIQEIEKLAKEVIKALEERHETLSTAESCTGGLVASHIIDVPGSSAVMKGGIVAYQNSIKEKLLGVNPQILTEKGAVSAETVLAMANGALEQFNSDWAISTSGIAGPGGAEPGKPVGTVWMAVGKKGKIETRCEKFTGNRTQIREKSVYKVLDMLLLSINNQKSTCTKEH